MITNKFVKKSCKVQSGRNGKRAPERGKGEELKAGTQSMLLPRDLN